MIFLSALIASKKLFYHFFQSRLWLFGRAKGVWGLLSDCWPEKS
jgi:hypothetical protein